MAKVVLGNASAITVPRQDRDSIRRFYLVGINEDLSKYEGTGEGPNAGKVKEAIERKE